MTRSAFCAAAVCIGTMSHADTVTFDLALPGVGFETVAGFDSSLGVLTSAEITISGSIGRQIEIFNPGQAVNETFSVSFLIQGPFPGLTASGSDSTTIDCGPACQETRTLFAEDSMTLFLTDPLDLASVTDVPLVFEVVSAFGGDFSGSASVSYTFTPTPVPLPAGLPLALSALGGFAWLRRRRG